MSRRWRTRSGKHVLITEVTKLIWLAFASLAFPSAALDAFPLASTVNQVRKNLETAKVAPTDLHRDDYIKIISGIVNCFRQFQTNDGRIIDPFRHKEVQYSTPCYAWAATALVVSGKQTNLLESATFALDSALEQLADAKAADGHGDFFTFPAMLAYEHLCKRVTAERRQRWEALLHAIKPERAYRDVLSAQHPTVHN